MTHLSGRAQPRRLHAQALPARKQHGEQGKSRRELPKPELRSVPSNLPALIAHRAAIFPTSLDGGRYRRKRSDGLCLRRFATACATLDGSARGGLAGSVGRRGAARGDGGGAGAARLAQLVQQPLQRHQQRWPPLRLRGEAPYLPAGCQHRRTRVLRYGHDPLLRRPGARRRLSLTSPAFYRGAPASWGRSSAGNRRAPLGQGGRGAREAAGAPGVGDGGRDRDRDREGAGRSRRVPSAVFWCRCRRAHRAHGQDLRVRVLPQPRAEQPLRQQLRRWKRPNLGHGGPGSGGGVQPAPGRVPTGSHRWRDGDSETERTHRVGWAFVGLADKAGWCYFSKGEFQTGEIKTVECFWPAFCSRLRPAALLHHLNKLLVTIKASVSEYARRAYSLPLNPAPLKPFQQVIVPHRTKNIYLNSYCHPGHHIGKYVHCAKAQKNWNTLEQTQMMLGVLADYFLPVTQC